MMKFAQNSYTLYAWFYFCPLVFIISFFLLQLTQAVIKSKFSEEHEKKKNVVGAKIKKKKGLQDFDHLTKEEKDKLLELQEGTRSTVLKKWKQILFLKKQMRIMVRDYKQRRKIETDAEKQKKWREHVLKMGGSLYDFPGFSIQESIDYAAILGMNKMNKQP